MTKRVDIAIFERNRLFREGLASILKEANYRIQASVSAPGDIEDRDLGVDSRIVFLVGEKQNGGFDAASIAQLKRRYLKCHIILLLETCSEEQRWQAEKMGASGVLLKSISGEVLIRSIELVLMGEHVFSASTRPISSQGGAMIESDTTGDAHPHPLSLKNGKDLTQAQVSAPAPAHTAGSNGTSVVMAASGHAELSTRRGQLSEREIEILNCLVEGSSNKVIARRCSIAEATVKVHLKAILRKIECANRTQAAVWALNKINAPRPAFIDVAAISAEPDRLRA